ncbi:putative rlpA-like protein, double-psi beta-barrel [Rosa chinensis]|uniref:Putative rlpA-like protein, double-psi beta-barrel n=1 Tax=Rosa chinensis TaxID=74649 RepID=A0A2P6S411_ROSCH|nr:putative rlpA-like protein, double-psi beta-barrel [Rosa chinensis]
MAKFQNLFTFAVLFVSTILVQAIAENLPVGEKDGVAWEDGHATFFGDMSGRETLNPEWCMPTAGTIKITATNFCPPNYDPKFNPWCNHPPSKKTFCTCPCLCSQNLLHTKLV